MRLSLVLLTGIFLITSCGPRQDEKDRGQNGGFNGGGNITLNAGQVERVTEQDAQLPSSTCGPREPGQNGLRWTTLFMRSDLKAFFGQAKDIKVFLNKGRNCHFVSNKKSIEIVFGDAPGVSPKDARKSGIFRFVTKLEAMNTADLLADEKRLKQAADDMAMTVDQVRAYLADNPRDKVSFTYLSAGPGGDTGKPGNGNSGGGSTGGNVGGDFTVKPGVEVIAKANGSQLPSCQKDDVWGQIRLNFLISDIEADADKLTHFLSVGAVNCYEVNTEKTVQLAVQEKDEGPFVAKDQHFKVTELKLMHVDDFLNNAALLTEVATGMVLPENEIKAMITESGESNLTIAKIETSEKIEAPEPGPATLVVNKPGEMVPACAGKTPWNSIRIFKNMEPQFKEPVENKKISVWVQKGDFNCLKIEDPDRTVGFVFDTGNKDTNNRPIFTEPDAFPISVKSISILSKQEILNVPFVRKGLAQGMGFVNENGIVDADQDKAFTEYIQNLNEDLVNVTEFIWL